MKWCRQRFPHQVCPSQVENPFVQHDEPEEWQTAWLSGLRLEDSGAQSCIEFLQYQG